MTTVTSLQWAVNSNEKLVVMTTIDHTIITFFPSSVLVTKVQWSNSQALLTTHEPNKIFSWDLQLRLVDQINRPWLRITLCYSASQYCAILLCLGFWVNFEPKSWHSVEICECLSLSIVINSACCRQVKSSILISWLPWVVFSCVTSTQHCHSSFFFFFEYHGWCCSCYVLM